MKLTMHEVRHGLRPVTFSGEIISESSTRKRLQPEDDWAVMSGRAKDLFLRWTEMTLYAVPAGSEEPEGIIVLPDGGYVYHVVGQSLCYHVHRSECEAGVQATAAETPDDALPCWKCRPPQLREWIPEDDETETLELIVPADMIVDMESPTHSVYTHATAAGITKIVERGRLSLPAQRLLEIARKHDAAIDAVYARPGPPRSAA